MFALVAIVAFTVGGALRPRTTTAAGSPTGARAGAGATAGYPPESSPGAGVASGGGSASYAGVVDIDTELGYQGARAAGTGMVLSASGEVVTNNHVVDGATTITATAVDTGHTYSARVVGTDPTEDVAVIQLMGASGLATVSTSEAAHLAVGDPVVAIGNAGGRGGTPSVVNGNIVALDQAITASDQTGANAERLTGLIEVDAPIEAGDSGGPLTDGSGTVIGMDTAAEVSGSRFRSSAQAGYAIPIAKARSVADQIESGKASATIHIGLPAFLGVQVDGSGSSSDFGPASGGAPVAGVVPGTPAASIGVAAGDTITSVDGRTVDSASGLSTLLQSARPGDKVAIGWVDQSGTEHTARATLATGPAD
ncbi:MAG TPA: trypsin-like peptidase domain-containing protein [Acidimicrobiales bacterium]|nr:trypsin-like peptidase domain-containing protein [Acidimicrobiales bacterium]